MVNKYVGFGCMTDYAINSDKLPTFTVAPLADPGQRTVIEYSDRSLT